MIDRIARYFGYVKASDRAWADEARAMMDTDRIARAQRWIPFYNEEGGVRDVITSLRKAYFEKIGKLQPGDVEGLQALGMADRIAREIDGHIRQIIDAGKIDASVDEHAAQIAALPEAQRRRL